jgi:hypothetical protein
VATKGNHHGYLLFQTWVTYAPQAGGLRWCNDLRGCLHFCRDSTMHKVKCASNRFLVQLSTYQADATKAFLSISAQSNFVIQFLLIYRECIDGDNEMESGTNFKRKHCKNSRIYIIAWNDTSVSSTRTRGGESSGHPVFTPKWNVLM